ncbi:uncharacterized protein AKAME5_001988700 [Lates japonicus]|uniref:G-protein coupled receptors family 1 profile domain-containing protein n=1 Tax=Lates japonicus TaxID=270547 RepID=A0AAD3NAQ9_LATJO|nr:uncharacterized protein AKAME5_001988700 [Lates japonicus]
MSNSDFFTYNMAVMELIGVLTDAMNFYSYFTSIHEIFSVTSFLGFYVWYGQMLFPVMTCVDRYVAVVHPITYLRLRQGVRVHIRNISTVCVWLLGFEGPGLQFLMEEYSNRIVIASACQMVFFLMAMLFCSLSVLRVLIRPRPGEVGGERMRIHQSKQRAFRTIMIITGVLLLKFGGNLVCDVVVSSHISGNLVCVLSVSRAWFSLPSSLVLPLLFLHRAGKLPGCKHHTESG